MLLILISLVFIKVVSDFDKRKEGVKTLGYLVALFATDFLVLCTQY